MCMATALLAAPTVIPAVAVAPLHAVIEDHPRFRTHGHRGRVTPSCNVLEVGKGRRQGGKREERTVLNSMLAGLGWDVRNERKDERDRTLLGR